MNEKTIKKIKNTAIAVVCIVSVAVSGIKYSGSQKKDSAEDHLVFYEAEKPADKTMEKTIQITEPENNTESSEGEKSSDKPEKESEIKDGLISINKASKSELMSLPGIGEKKADAIIEYRKAYGGFVSIDELTQVKGIGEGILSKIRDKIKL